MTLPKRRAKALDFGLAVHCACAVWLTAAACHMDGTRESSGPPMGQTNASTNDMVPEGAGAFDERSLAEISARGRQLHRLERLWKLAHEVGLPRAGSVRADVLLPLAELDEAGRSGEVVFYRWMGDVGKEPLDPLDPLQASRWLVVPVLFEPDRVLENEQFSDPVEKGSRPHRRLQAFILAAIAGRELAPQGTWRIYTFREYVQHATRRIPQTRVYMLGNGEAPDIELVVSDARRRHPAAASEVTVHHRRGRVGDDGGVLELAARQVGPLSVTRALARGGAPPKVEVRGASGARWRIATHDGSLELVTERRSDGATVTPGPASSAQEQNLL